MAQKKTTSNKSGAQRKTSSTAKAKKSTKRKTKKASKKFELSTLNWKRIAAYSAISGLILVVLFLFSIWIGLFGKLPTETTLRNIQQPIASEIYGFDGALLGKYFIQNRSHTEFDEISPFFIQALIATEDTRFYKHRGVDYRSLGRVFFKTLLMMNRSSGGGSTITQQLAKNLFPRKRYWMASTVVNKFREMFIAARIERVYSKEDILTLYLNTVPFGENVFGIGVATERFFDTDPSNLLPEESALLVGMLKATTYYSPRLYPERAKLRRNVVFDQMIKYGYLKPEDAEILKQSEIELKYSRRTDTEGLAMYFRKYLMGELKQWCKTHHKENGEPYNLYTDGLRIFTSIDPTLQSMAEKAVTETVSELQKKFDEKLDSWKPYYKALEEATVRSNRYRNLKKAGLDYKAIQEEFGKEIDMSIYRNGDYENTKMSPIDSIKHYLKMLQGSFLVMNPATGEIKAWVGGTDHRQYGIDYVTSRRQVGSTFKPFVYAAALEDGYTPCTYYDNERITYSDYKDWSPRNSNGEYGGSYSMSGALMNSVNTVSVQVLFDAGIEHTIELAHRCGIQSDIPQVPSIALGTAELNLLEMVTAYATIANDGYRVQPTFLYRIEDQDGNVLEEFAQPGFHEGEKVLDDTTTIEILQMMQNVVDRGTAQRLRSQYQFNFEIAGKTGTTQNQSDGWFIGMTPNLVAGAWVGANDRRIHFQSLNDGQGARTALPIWGNFFTQVTNDPKYRSRLHDQFIPSPIFASFVNDCETYSEFDAEYMNALMDRVSEPDLADELADLLDPDRRRKRIKPQNEKGLKGLLNSIFGKKENKQRRKKRRSRRKK